MIANLTLTKLKKHFEKKISKLKIPDPPEFDESPESEFVGDTTHLHVKGQTAGPADLPLHGAVLKKT